jgi:hypothetical protein
MTKWDALGEMLNLFIIEVGSHTDFSMFRLLDAMERELKYRRAYPNSCTAAWMEEFVQSYRLAKAVHKAYPNLSDLHKGPVNICYLKKNA